MASGRNRYGGTGTPTGAGALSAARAITQSAAGVPTHTAPKNTLYRNETTGILYINTDGATTWVAVGSGTGTVGQQGRPGEDGRDGEDSYVPGPQGIPGTPGGAGADGRMGPPGWDAEPADDFGLWVPPGVPVSPRFRSMSGNLTASGALYETMHRIAVVTNVALLSSQRISLVAIDLPIDLPVTSISFLSGGTPLAVGTNQLFGLYDSALALLRGSVDDGATAWAANVIKTLALTSIFRTTYSGLHYLAILINAVTPPTLLGMAANTAVIFTILPKLSGSGNTGITALPNPSTMGTGASFVPYAYVS